MHGVRSVLGPTLCPAHRNVAAHHRPASVWDYKDTYEIYLTLIKTLLGASIWCADSSINPPWNPVEGETVYPYCR